MSAKLGYQTLSVLFSDISIMITTADSMSDILEALARDAKEPLLRQVLSAVLEQLEEGEPLSAAMAKTGAFPEYAVTMTAAGENVGRLENVTASLAEFYDKREKMRSLISAALLQPVLLLTLLAVIMGCFMGLVLPMLSRVYRTLGGETGLYTKVANGVALAAFLLILAVLVISFSLWMNFRHGSQSGRLSKLWKSSRLTAPLSSLFSLAFFISDLATRVAGGCMVDTAFEEAAEHVTDPALKAKTARCTEALGRGESLASVVYEEGLLPHICCHIVAGGMRNGNPEQALDRVGELLLEEAESRTEELVREVEPLLTGFFTVAVGISLLSIMIPLIGVITAIG